MHFPVYSKAFLQTFFKKNLGSIFGLPCRFNGTKKLLRMTLKCAPKSQPSLSKSKLSPPFTLLFISKFLEPPFFEKSNPLRVLQMRGSALCFCSKKEFKNIHSCISLRAPFISQVLMEFKKRYVVYQSFYIFFIYVSVKRTVSTIWLVTLCCEFHFRINYQCHVILQVSLASFASYIKQI